MCSPAQLSCLWNLTSNCKKPPLMSCQRHSSGPNPKQSWLLLRTTAANTPSQSTWTGQGLFIPALGLLEDRKGSTGQASREGREYNYKSMGSKKTTGSINLVLFSYFQLHMPLAFFYCVLPFQVDTNITTRLICWKKINAIVQLL